ncbi:ABC transporter permease [Dactylosporangium fulvum]|uniref:ABC transporter permease n=1 Tax=Dactylosporangium fulvum TaxID=53359 RepID=A0ABY5VSK1_9ACTN|nr:ABC transporter permease [Dactylosporangium fulvum]UWP80076.1 ABC transporter permease [Dactylosporangium fulvum]
MLQTLLRRLVRLVPTLILVSVATFSLTYLVPGDPAITLAGDAPTPERIAEIRADLGLHRPVVVQYFDWVGGVVTGDFGHSIYGGADTVADLIVQKLPVDISLAIGGLLVALLVGVPLGILAAVRRGSIVDRIVTAFTSVSVALPSYWIALLLVLLFAVNLRWLPASGYTPPTEDPVAWVRGLVLPSIAIGLAMTAELARQLRTALVDVLDQQYVRTARAKGLRAWVVIGKHAMKNAAITPLTILGLQIASILGGAVIIEQIFGLPGLGQLAIEAVLQRDIPVIQGVVMTAVLVVVVCNLLVDLSYIWLNPRARRYPPG